MRRLVIFAVLIFAVTSTETDHDNWRTYMQWVTQQSPTNNEPRKACDEPFAHGLPFRCDFITRPQPPTSVHKLSPGDVKVVGAIGDSITAGNGAHACKLVEVFNEYRGASFSIGGDDDLPLALTLPNILRQYNRDLIGYSLGVGKVDSNTSNFNCAVPGSVASDMPGQAMELVRRMLAHPDVDIQNDWKVITLFVGANDLCDHCKEPANYTLETYMSKIVQTLDLFQEKLPRTFVNVVGALNMTELITQGGFLCQAAITILCGCIINLEPTAKLELEKLNRAYQINLRALAESGRYDTREDFTVVYQPFLENTEFPVDENGDIDQTYMAPDCFHLSAKGQAFAARELWTNMLQPVGRKNTQWDPDAKSIPCPTQEQPYFATMRNNKVDPSTEGPRTRPGAPATSPSTNEAGRERPSVVGALLGLLAVSTYRTWLGSSGPLQLS